jgi:hypothetical protein
MTQVHGRPAPVRHLPYTGKGKAEIGLCATVACRGNSDRLNQCLTSNFRFPYVVRGIFDGGPSLIVYSMESFNPAHCARFRHLMVRQFARQLMYGQEPTLS